MNAISPLAFSHSSSHAIYSGPLPYTALQTRQNPRALQSIFFQRLVDVGAVVVDPEFFGPGGFGGGFGVEEDDVGFDVHGCTNVALGHF